ncbi:MAG: hypothetical protein KAG26_02065 [Methylococcales bacterium]|nr:hypothetical protein [Methylococcales bacterium]
MRLIKTLAVISIVLIAAIMAEISFAKYSKKKLQQELKQNIVENIEIETLPSINLKKTLMDSYVDFVQRPLFNHNRRPIELTPPVEKVVEKVVVVKEKIPEIKIIPFKHELIGIYGINGKKTALFRNKAPRINLSLRNKKSQKKSKIGKKQSFSFRKETPKKDKKPLHLKEVNAEKPEKYEKFLRFQEGMIIDNWTIKKINSNDVIIENQGQIATVSWSSFRPKAAKPFKRFKKRKVTIKSRSKSKNINPFLQAQKRNQAKRKQGLIPPPPPPKRR